MPDVPYTTSVAMLEAMHEAGIRYLFANLGSDHSGIIEAYSAAGPDGWPGRFPELVLPAALAASLAEVRGGRPAVISVRVPSVELPESAPGQPGQKEDRHAPAS